MKYNLANKPRLDTYIPAANASHNDFLKYADAVNDWFEGFAKELLEYNKFFSKMDKLSKLRIICEIQGDRVVEYLKRHPDKIEEYVKAHPKDELSIREALKE